MVSERCKNDCEERVVEKRGDNVNPMVKIEWARIEVCRFTKRVNTDDQSWPIDLTRHKDRRSMRNLLFFRRQIYKNQDDFLFPCLLISCFLSQTMILAINARNAKYYPPKKLFIVMIYLEKLDQSNFLSYQILRQSPTFIS